VKTAQKLIKRSMTWHALSEQDTNAMFALTHANYALAYARVAKNLGKRQDVEQVTHLNLEEWIQTLEINQDRMMQRVVHECPNLAPETAFRSITGWI
jgi:hypothetical protein